MKKSKAYFNYQIWDFRAGLIHLFHYVGYMEAPVNSRRSLEKKSGKFKISLATSNCPFCPSSDNPADCASRGINPGDLLTHPLWFTGPPWLKYDQESYAWHVSPYLTVVSNKHTKEQNSSCFVTMGLSQDSEKSIFDLFPYSSFNRVKRTLAWCLRWNHKCTKQVTKKYFWIA